MIPDRAKIWTIGHSNNDLTTVMRRLRGEKIEFVVDVRSYPYSKYSPQFNRDELKRSLADGGITYLFLGEELGGRPSDEDHYDEDGHALYGEMAALPAFRDAINRLIDGADQHRIAVMCSCGKPDDCHRRLLVGKVLAEHGVELRHILPSGEIKAERSVDLRFGKQGSFFDAGDSLWRSTQSVSHRRRKRYSATSLSRSATTRTPR